MSKRSWWLVAASAVAVAGYAYAQYPVMDRVADKVVKKYQSASCEQLWQQKGQPPGTFRLATAAHRGPVFLDFAMEALFGDGGPDCILGGGRPGGVAHGDPAGDAFLRRRRGCRGGRWRADRRG